MEIPKLSKLAYRMVVVFVCTGLVLSACAGGADQALTPTAGPTSEFDQMFIDMMVPHHQAAIEMARIAQEQAEHPEIQLMADRIIEDQENEVEQLQAWRQAWYGSNSTPPMSEMPMLPGMTQMDHGAMTMDMTEDVEMLRTTPDPFDRTFIDLMIGHHQMAIDAARMAPEQATREEVREVAQQIVEKQQQEIDQLKAWRLEWYGSAEPEPTPMP